MRAAAQTGTATGTVAFIGAGNMAEAIARGLLAAGLRPDQLRASDPVEARRSLLATQLGIRTHAENAAALAGADLVVLAVKPQHLANATASLPAGARPLFLSIVAGASLESLRRQLGAGARVVRSMPNTPALIGAGIAALHALAGVDGEGRKQAAAVLEAVGGILWCEREEELDAVTAVSGSGPAYVFYFLEALEQAASELGFAPEEARRLAYATFSGAIRLAEQSGSEPALLRAQVTSKGGTTERAIAALDQAAVKAAIVAAVKAAAERANEMGEMLGKES